MRVIAIHGAAVNADTWRPLRRELGAAYEMIAGDLPGHGTRRGEPFAFERAVDEIAASVAREVAPPLLTGDSLGGYIALAVAARGVPLAGVVAGSCTWPMRGAAGALARASLAAGALVSERALRALLARACGPEDARAIAARGLAPAMRNVTLRALLGRDVLADVSAIRAPVTFAEGALDLPAVWQARRFARAAAAGRATIVRGAPHGLGLTHPAAFAAAVRATG